jgi:hypothetical protein
VVASGNLQSGAAAQFTGGNFITPPSGYFGWATQGSILQPSDGAFTFVDSFGNPALGTNKLVGTGATGALTNIVVGSGLAFTNGTLTATGSGGTVTSVGLTSPGVVYTVSGSPVTGAGSLALNLVNQSSNTFFAGPISNGAAAAPTWRGLHVSDFASGSGASGTTFWRGDGTWATPAGGVSGSGTANRIPYWTSSSALGDSGIIFTNSVWNASPLGKIYSPDGSSTVPGLVVGSDPRIGLSRVADGYLSVIVPSTPVGPTTGNEYFRFGGDGLHATALDVTNTFKFQSGAGAGKVLTSDASGVGTWITPAAGVGTPGFTITSGILTANQTNIDNGTAGTNAFCIVGGSGSAVTNAANLLAAYTAAKTKTPNGAALNTANRYTILLLPGVYDLGTNTLTLDTQFIDIVGVSPNTGAITYADRVDLGDTLIKGSGSVVKLTSGPGDIRVANIAIFTSGLGSFSYAFDSSVNIPGPFKMQNVLVDGTGGGNDAPMVVGVTWGGVFIDVRCWHPRAFGAAFSSGGDISSGTFIRCKALATSFGMTASGTFIDCECDAGMGKTTANGTYIRCREVVNAGDGGTLMGGTFTGTAIDCYTVDGVLNYSSGIVQNCVFGTTVYNLGLQGPAATSGSQVVGNYARWAGTNTIGNSLLSSDATNIWYAGVGALGLPIGTTAQRPSNATNGFTRYNTDTARTEFYSGSTWNNHVRLGGDTMTGPLTNTASVLTAPIISGESLSGTTTNTSTFSGTFTNTGNIGLSGTLLTGTGSVGTPGISIGSTSYGLYQTGFNLAVALSGTARYAFTLNSPAGFCIDSASLIEWIPGGVISGTPDLFIGRENAAVIQLGVDATLQTTPVNQTIKGPDALAGTATNINGANLTIAGGRNTGSGIGGSLLFQTAPAGSTGTAAGTLTTRLTIDSTGLATYANAVSAPTNVAAFQYSTGWLGALATPKTNANQRAMLLVSIGWVDSATGRPEATVAITGCCTNVYSEPGTIVSTFTNTINCGFINPSAVVTVTDTSTGTGASVTLVNSVLESE